MSVTCPSVAVAVGPGVVACTADDALKLDPLSEKVALWVWLGSWVALSVTFSPPALWPST